MTAHIVIAKQPIPGRVKTRLCPPLSPGDAAALAAAALADTLDTVDAGGATTRVLCFDGNPSGWLRTGWVHRRQCGGGLDARLADAFGATRQPAVIVGMDTPQLAAVQLDRFDPDRFDACLGPTADGGYWAIGFRDPAVAPAALLGVPMSTDHTYAAQLHRLRSLDLEVQLLDPLVDVDDYAAACDVAALAPRTRFARAFAALEPGAA